MSENNANAFWTECWQQNRTPWDLEGAHPLLAGLLATIREFKLLPEKGTVFVPGCGKAHDGAWWANNSFEVWAADLVPEAIEAAKTIYGKQSNLHFFVHDVLTPLSQYKNHFHLVYDRAMLCALPPKLWPTYLERCFETLKENGIFTSILFTKVNRVVGPPFAISADELFSAMEGKAKPLFYQVQKPNTSHPAILQEALTAWIKT